MNELKEQVVLRACEYRDKVIEKNAIPEDQKEAREQARSREWMARKKLLQSVELYQNNGMSHG